ncbi:MAG: hypothetical protein JXJ17_02010 [Anaerolineae bacterium]|nr:hypothetical protein [Anaerolineae bacterium]
MCPNITYLALFGGYGLDTDLRSVWQSILKSLSSDPLPGDPPSLLGLYAASGSEKPGAAQRYIQQVEEYFAALEVDLSCRVVNQGDSPMNNPGDFPVLLLGGDFDRTVQFLAGDRRPSKLVTLAGSTAAVGELAVQPGDDRVVLRAASGLLPGLIVLPFFDWLSGDLLAGIEAQRPDSLTLLGIDRSAALVYQNGTWQVTGAGSVSIKPPGGEFVSISAGRHSLLDHLPPPSIVSD